MTDIQRHNMRVALAKVREMNRNLPIDWRKPKRLEFYRDCRLGLLGPMFATANLMNQAGHAKG